MARHHLISIIILNILETGVDQKEIENAIRNYLRVACTDLEKVFESSIYADHRMICWNSYRTISILNDEWMV